MPKQAACLLLVSEQASLCAALARLLRPLGYRIEIASSEKRARQLINEGPFAVAIAVMAGFGACESGLLRELHDTVPKLVILVDGANEIGRWASCFPEALVCRSDPLEHEKLLAFLSEPGQQTPDSAGDAECLQFEGCVLDLTGRVFLDAEQNEVPLTRGEFALLVAFARNYGRALSRGQLRAAMDGGSAEPYDRSIDMLVARLRRKIEQNPAKPRVIITVPGFGYKFVPQVRREVSTSGGPSTSPMPGAASVPWGERRQITMLCCEIPGLAALAAKSDNENLDMLVGPYLACTEVIDRFCGVVVRTHGDTVLACFGYPRAHDNDAANAVRAALELVRGSRGLVAAPSESFGARGGIASGSLHGGEPGSIGGRDANLVAVVHLALHTQKAAPAGGVAISSSTRNLVSELFRCRQIPPVELDDGFEPAPAWHIVEG